MKNSPVAQPVGAVVAGPGSPLSGAAGVAGVGAVVVGSGVGVGVGSVEGAPVGVGWSEGSLEGTSDGVDALSVGTFSSF